jgi:hypothetical protein
MKSIFGHTSFGLLLALALLIPCGIARAQVRVVNMIPHSVSSETKQDSEPNLAVNPANPSQIAGSAFTPDPLGTYDPVGNTFLAPIYVSTDGGNTWTLNPIVPNGNPNTGTNDITLRFGGTSNVLYVGNLRGDNTVSLGLNISRTPNFTAPTPVEVLVDIGGFDQPYVQAATVPWSSLERVYVGNSRFDGGAPFGESVYITQQLDAANAVNDGVLSGFTLNGIETRPPTGLDSDAAPVRTAVHPNGTVYATFYHVSGAVGININVATLTADVVVVRDDEWGQGATPYTDLKDGDNLAGKRVVTGVTVPINKLNPPAFGQQRVVASNLSIAVDPRDSNVVYLAWADYIVPDYRLHVRRSMDSGHTWSPNDLLTVSHACNPALAINMQGKIGFLYQQLTGAGANMRWETHLRRSPDGFDWTDDLTLARPLANTPTVTYGPYLGDYAHLMAVGKNFYGIFSANNTPDMANFPNGVTYQRNANFTTNTLLSLNNSPVAISIDPFFFSVTEQAPEDDFYVRDWTVNAANADTGLEPSTNPVFYNTSDVWNRRGSLPGGFGGSFDQPEGEDAGNGAGDIGDNWAFARIRRNALPAVSTLPSTVTAHFLVAPFGAGSNYMDGTTGPVSFLGSDPTVTFNATDIGPFTTAGQQWHLDAVASQHICMAVEISAPGDPYAGPSLSGYAPGWTKAYPNILDDNNRAQRNMGLSTTPARGVGFRPYFYAVIHNAATFPRDIVVRYDATPDVERRLRGASVEIVGGRSKPFKSGDTITLAHMQPGENRWLGFSYNAPQGREGEILPVNFSEMVGGAAVNGFTIAARPSSMSRVIRNNLESHRAVFTRMAAGFDAPGAREEADAAQKLNTEKPLTEVEYLGHLRSHLNVVERALTHVRGGEQQGDVFGTAEALNALTSALKSGNAERAAVAHLTLLNRLDSYLTMQQLMKGNPADILQNVRWQKDLFTKVPALARLRCSSPLLNVSEKFISAFGERRASIKDYPALIDSSASCLREGEKLLFAGQQEAPKDVLELKRNSGDLAALQRTHWELLLKLQSLAR